MMHHWRYAVTDAKISEKLQFYYFIKLEIRYATFPSRLYNKGLTLNRDDNVE